jgi:hydroxymethylpyrimidine/phosphomethylpyrimidine kinase
VGRRLTSLADMRRAAREIAALGPAAVVIKGGHAGGDPVDLLFEGGELTEFPGPRIPTTSDHGTGCTFSAAIAAQLALGTPLPEAVGIAKRFVAEAMRTAVSIGGGRGPLNHFFGFRRGE